MRRYIAPLAVAALALGLPVIGAGSASAFGGEVLDCAINPGGGSLPGYPDCTTGTAASDYNVTFTVANESGSYTYAWTVPSHIRGETASSGCTSTSNTCSFAINGGAESIIDISVVVTQGGQNETLQTEADVPAVCGNELC